MVIVQQAAEARATVDLAICPVVIRRTGKIVGLLLKMARNNETWGYTDE